MDNLSFGADYLESVETVSFGGVNPFGEGGVCQVITSSNQRYCWNLIYEMGKVLTEPL